MELEFFGFLNRYKKELNLWQKQEQEAGYNGLNQFVVLEGELLGDYLSFINTELKDITCLLAKHKDKQNLVGFVCYSQKSEHCLHIECLGIKPSLRGKG